MSTSFEGNAPSVVGEAKYRLAFKSLTGRFITPADPSKLNEAEILFVEGVARKFHLVGYQPINNGAAGRAAQEPGLYGVF
jgi:hypothetical protein